MRIIDFKHMDTSGGVYFYGDIHGDFLGLVYSIINRYSLKDCVVFVCGDIGMGFHKVNYYGEMFKKMNHRLKDKNVNLILIRGNHDNPDYFKSDNGLMGKYTNVHLIDDYEVLQLNNYNVLCIGGAVSVDKYCRTENVSWWAGEEIKYLDLSEFKNDISNIQTNTGLNIDIVCTHTSPAFCEPLSKEGLQYFAKHDPSIIDKCDFERKYLTDIYDILSDNCYIKYWFYGHFHNNYYNYLHNNTNFNGLGIMEIKEAI